MTNFTNKMTLIEFQIHSASKITHLQVHRKDSCDDTFEDIGEHMDSISNQGKWRNRKRLKG